MERFLRVALLPQAPGVPSPQFFPALSGYSGEGGGGLVKGKPLLYQTNITSGTSFQYPTILGEAALALRKGTM